MTNVPDRIKELQAETKRQSDRDHDHNTGALFGGITGALREHTELATIKRAFARPLERRAFAQAAGGAAKLGFGVAGGILTGVGLSELLRRSKRHHTTRAYKEMSAGEKGMLSAHRQLHTPGPLGRTAERMGRKLFGGKIPSHHGRSPSLDQHLLKSLKRARNKRLGDLGARQVASMFERFGLKELEHDHKEGHAHCPVCRYEACPDCAPSAIANRREYLQGKMSDGEKGIGSAVSGFFKTPFGKGLLLSAGVASGAALAKGTSNVAHHAREAYYANRLRKLEEDDQEYEGERRAYAAFGIKGGPGSGYWGPRPKETDRDWGGSAPRGQGPDNDTHERQQAAREGRSSSLVPQPSIPSSLIPLPDNLAEIRQSAFARSQRQLPKQREKAMQALIQDVARLQRMKMFHKPTKLESELIKRGDNRVDGYARALGVNALQLNAVAAELRNWEDANLGITKFEQDRNARVDSMRAKDKRRSIDKFTKKLKGELGMIAWSPIQGARSAVTETVRDISKRKTQGGIGAFGDILAKRRPSFSGGAPTADEGGSRAGLSPHEEEAIDEELRHASSGGAGKLGFHSPSVDARVRELKRTITEAPDSSSIFAHRGETAPTKVFDQLTHTNPAVAFRHAEPAVREAALRALSTKPDMVGGLGNALRVARANVLKGELGRADEEHARRLNTAKTFFQGVRRAKSEVSKAEGQAHRTIGEGILVQQIRKTSARPLREARAQAKDEPTPLKRETGAAFMGEFDVGNPKHVDQLKRAVRNKPSREVFRAIASLQATGRLDHQARTDIVDSLPEGKRNDVVKMFNALDKVHTVRKDPTSLSQHVADIREIEPPKKAKDTLTEDQMIGRIVDSKRPPSAKREGIAKRPMTVEEHDAILGRMSHFMARADTIPDVPSIYATVNDLSKHIGELVPETVDSNDRMVRRLFQAITKPYLKRASELKKKEESLTARYVKRVGVRNEGHSDIEGDDPNEAVFGAEAARQMADAFRSRKASSVPGDSELGKKAAYFRVKYLEESVKTKRVDYAKAKYVEATA